MTRLLIVGATGLVGQQVVAQALGDARVSRVVALTRRAMPSHERLENVVIDFADLPREADWWAVDGVVCAMGTTRAKTSSPDVYRQIDYGYPLAIARLAREHGATRFALTSSLGADARSRFAYPRLKGELEEALTGLSFPSLTIVRPSVLGGDRAERRLGEHAYATALRLFAPLVPRRLRVSAASAVAATLLDGAVAGPPGVHFKYNDDMG
jgi:uncharacterized protein YbjT (DUF2867 family)